MQMSGGESMPSGSMPWPVPYGVRALGTAGRAGSRTARGLYRRLKVYERTKRALDLSLTVAIMPFVLVVLAICVVAIKLESPGAPALFRQQRTGKGGRRF